MPYSSTALAPSDRKALHNLCLENLTDLLAMNDHTVECLMAVQHPCQLRKIDPHHICQHPVDKFRISDNSRRHVFCWLLAKLLLGIRTPVDNEDLMKVFWKIFESTCPNGHRGRNRHYMRDDGQVCVNPFHFRLDRAEAKAHNVIFVGDFFEKELRFSETPMWTFHMDTSGSQPLYVFTHVAKAQQAMQPEQMNVMSSACALPSSAHPNTDNVVRAFGLTPGGVSPSESDETDDSSTMSLEKRASREDSATRAKRKSRGAEQQQEFVNPNMSVLYAAAEYRSKRDRKKGNGNGNYDDETFAAQALVSFSGTKDPRSQTPSMMMMDPKPMAVPGPFGAPMHSNTTSIPFAVISNLPPNTVLPPKLPAMNIPPPTMAATAMPSATSIPSVGSVGVTGVAPGESYLTPIDLANQCTANYNRGITEYMKTHNVDLSSLYVTPADMAAMMYNAACFMPMQTPPMNWPQMPTGLAPQFPTLAPPSNLNPAPINPNATPLTAGPMSAGTLSSGALNSAGIPTSTMTNTIMPPTFLPATAAAMTQPSLAINAQAGTASAV